MADVQIGYRIRGGRERHGGPDEVDSNVCACGMRFEDHRSGRLGAAGFDLCRFGIVQDPELLSRAGRLEAASRNRQAGSAPHARNAARLGREDAWQPRPAPDPKPRQGNVRPEIRRQMQITE